MSTPEIIAIRIKELRKKLNMTQKEFSNHVGIKQQTLSGYERGIMKPSVDILKEIAGKCGVSIDWLCGLVNEESYSDELLTYADVIKQLLRVERAIWNVKISATKSWDKYGRLSCFYGAMVLPDVELAQFFEGWEGTKKLHDAGTIDDNLYTLWINQQIEKYSFQILTPDAQSMTVQILEQEHNTPY